MEAWPQAVPACQHSILMSHSQSVLAAVWRQVCPDIGSDRKAASDGAGCPCRLQEWAQSVHEDMDPDKETVLLCHHGVRSMRVAGFLAAQVTASSCS